MNTFMNFEKEFRKRLKAIKESRRLSELAELSGVEQSRLSKTISHNQQLGLDKVSKILDVMGAKVVFPDQEQKEAAREVCFVNARVAPAGEYQQRPQEEDYIAVPLVDEVGAGAGIIPQGKLLSWFLVYKHQDAVRYKNNLIAVKIGSKSTSMVPLLHPEDIVLVDLDDRDTRVPGHIMLVLDPDDGSGMIKRVSVEQKNNDFQITFYSDNAARNPPSVYSWRDHFLKDWNRAIAGRVVWAWTDLTGK